MPPFGLGRKEQPQSFTTDITDKEDLQEIKEIAEMLNPNEEGFVVILITSFFPNKVAGSMSSRSSFHQDFTYRLYLLTKSLIIP